MVALSDGHEETYGETDCSQVTVLGTDIFLDGREGKYNQDKLLRSNRTRYGCSFLGGQEGPDNETQVLQTYRNLSSYFVRWARGKYNAPNCSNVTVLDKVTVLATR